MKGSEDKVFLKSKAKREQQSLILASRPDFQADIAAIRKRYKIPANGFKDINSGKQEAWWHWIGEETEKWHDKVWPTFRQELKQLQEDALAKKIPYTKFVDRQAEINLIAPLNAFYNDIKQLRIKYRLGPSWKDGLRGYILLNNPKNIRNKIGVRMGVPHQPGEDDEEIHIVIDEDTTLDEVKAAWPLVKFHQKRLSYMSRQKHQPADYDVLEKGAEAYRLKTIEGKTLSEIATIFDEKYPFEDEDKVYTYSEISTIIRNYKKLVGIN
ncbi:MAG: hypothetical protein ABSD10_02895 [Candidatus Saccharimonadales bacterium]|jgi:hypothetical protein